MFKFKSPFEGMNPLESSAIKMVIIFGWMLIASVFTIGGLTQQVDELKQQNADLRVNMEALKSE